MSVDHRDGGGHESTISNSYILPISLADAMELWQWHQDVVNGRIQRRQVNLVLVDAAGQGTWRWVIEKAYPVKWSGASFNAATDAVLVESVELVHNGIRRG